MAKQLLVCTVISVLSIMALSPVAAQTTPCCDDPPCREAAKKRVTSVGNATLFLGPFRSGYPVDFAGKKRFLDSLKGSRPLEYDVLRSAIKELNQWSRKEPSRVICLSRAYQDLTEDQLYWLSYFRTSFYASSFRSPEFRKGFGSLFHAGTGASALFKSAERFASVGGLLLSYTFATDGQASGGRFRVLIGPGWYYSAARTFWLVHPRLEYRLSDIGNEMTSIGCLKLVAQGGFQRQRQLAGAGLAIELSRFHIQLTHNYVFDESVFVLQAGLGYSITF